MNVQEQIAKLESLLHRIRRNADAPRPPGTTAASTSASVSAVHTQPAPPAELEELDMMDAEIVEIDGAAGLEEPVPESAPRAAQALADEADLEPPVKTPPPESGRQIMAPPSPAVAFKDDDEAEEADLTGGGDVDALLEPDLSDGPISKAPPGMPTMEQLGETVELEGADHPSAELELLLPADKEEAPPDELELSLPSAEFQGGYDARLAPPLEAKGDLERLREASVTAVPAPTSLSEPGSFMSAPPSAAALSGPPTVVAHGGSPTVIERPAIAAPHAAEIIASKPAKVPTTFLEVLDASLGL